MKFISNTLEFQLSEMLAYGKEKPTDWEKEFELAQHDPIISIEVVNDSEPIGKVINAVWTWIIEYEELQLFSIECSHDLLDSIGPTIFAMIKAIGLHYHTKKITLSVPVNSYEWDWYQNVIGFNEVDHKESEPPSPNLELIL